MNKKNIFITGGARSGKSSFAITKASGFKGKKAYIATAEALDEEMEERIKKHKKDRGEDWDTYEEPLHISKVIEKIGDKYSVVLLDCLTLWLSNLIMNNMDIEEEINTFVCSLSAIHCPLYIVSNEVGMGIVPENEIARRFRDMAGMLNQEVAEKADEVYMMVSGIPVKLKSE